MSNLKQTINDDLKTAMRAKDQKTLSVLRMLNSAIKDREISLRKGEDVSLDDEQVIGVLKSEMKKRKDSISAYEAGGRSDLVENEKEEIKILEKYLPPSLGDEEIEKVVKEAVGSMEEVSMKDFGKVMGQVMARFKGQADGNQVSAAVKKILSN